MGNNMMGAGLKRAAISVFYLAVLLSFVGLLQERAYLVRFLLCLLRALAARGDNYLHRTSAIYQ
jgi:hypothetical protein